MYHNPVEVVETDNWKEKCIYFQGKYEIQYPLVITSNGNYKRHDLGSVFNCSSIFRNINPDPDFESCQAAINFIDSSKYDGVIAIGGGSVMDTAKVAMAYMRTKIANLGELLTITDPYTYSVPSIFIPTTHGTGSEVTMWGTIWNKEEKKKYSISHPDLYPNVAILDGNLSLSLPLDISIITVMDALSHSFETIWNKNANPKSTSLAIDAICIILQNIEMLKENPMDVTIRRKMLKAANIAGLGFSNTKTAAAHSISYPLTMLYSIPHGIASSISLIPILLINKDFIKDPINKICKNNKYNFEKLIKVIQSIPKGIVAYTLSEWGVNKNMLNKIADESFTKGRMDNNIVDLDKMQVLKILTEVY